jgi:ferritin-like metal-binding protein YciE
MTDTQSLRAHLITELRDLLDAEQRLVPVLKGFAQQAVTPALRVAFEKHARETEGHVQRLTEAFHVIGEPAEAKRCEAIQGLLKEGNSVVGSTPEGALRDAVMITSAQKVEHYEIASYGTARTYAQVLGQPAVARLLEQTLEEEKLADLNLTDIAEQRVNAKAAEEWHQAAAGLLEQTATLAGRAVALGSRTAGRAADVVGRRNIEQAAGNISEAAEAAFAQARRLAGTGSKPTASSSSGSRGRAQANPSSRKPASSRKPTRKSGRKVR